MKTVLQPLNEKARDIIVNRADLLEAPSVEPLLLQLVAHVSAYRVILARSVLMTPLAAVPPLGLSCICQGHLEIGTAPMCACSCSADGNMGI